MGFKDLTNKVKKSAIAYNEKQKQAKADKLAEAKRLEDEENARRNKIVEGKVKPINLTINLESGEKAYASFQAIRNAKVERIVEHTTTTTKRKGVVGRAVVGGVLLGPLGALGGAATAKSKGQSKTTQQTVSSITNIDSGKLILTNKRVLFVGDNIVSIPYDQVLAHSYDTVKFNNYRLNLKYPDMLPQESYSISGPQAEDAYLYYQGITLHKRSKPVKRLPSL